MSDVIVRLTEIRNELEQIRNSPNTPPETEAEAAALELEARNSLCETIADLGTDWFAVLNHDAVIQWVTENCRTLFGWRPDDLVGSSMQELVHEEDRAHVPWGTSWAIDSPITYRLRLANGLYHWVETRSVTQASGERRVIATRDINAHYIAQAKASDISELFVDELERMAHTDALTLLPNRRAVERTLNREISRSSRTGTPVSVVFFDIDRFKAINDTYGHLQGDEVLKNVGQQIANSLRPYDSIGRWGGDEFLVVLPDTDGDHAVSAARRLSSSLATNTAIGPVTVSGGVAQHGGEPLERLVDRADKALYRAKGGGRNRIEVEESPTS